jgi:hypothetical protein
MPTAVFAAKEKDDDMVFDAIQELTDIEPDYQEEEASDYGAAGPKPSKRKRTKLFGGEFVGW